MSLADYTVHSYISVYEPRDEFTYFTAVSNKTGALVAVKEGTPSDISKANEAIRAALIQGRLSHPNISKVYDCFLEQTENGLFKSIVIEEPLQIDLFSEIKARKDTGRYWTENELLLHFRSICDACSFAQRQNIAHRDIKPQNIFLSSDGGLKLSNFSMHSQITANCLTKTVRGTAFYLSPEIKVGFANVMAIGSMVINEYDPFKSDVYSLGVTFLQMTLLEPPIKLMNLSELKESMREVLDEVAIYPYVQYVAECMLAIKPEDRAAYSVVVQYLDTVLNPPPVQCPEYQPSGVGEQPTWNQSGYSESQMQCQGSVSAENSDIDDLQQKFRILGSSGPARRQKECMICTLPVSDLSWQMRVPEGLNIYRAFWSDLCSLDCLQELHQRTSGPKASSAPNPELSTKANISGPIISAAVSIPTQMIAKRHENSEKDPFRCLFCYSPGNMTVLLQCGHGFENRACLARFVLTVSNNRHAELPSECPLCKSRIDLSYLINLFGGIDEMHRTLTILANAKICHMCKKTADSATPDGKSICLRCSTTMMRLSTRK